MAAHQLRPTRLSDLPLLREIEWASGQRFREYGLEHVADDEPASGQELAGYVERAASWVSLEGDDHPVGYVLIDSIDDAAHIEQLSVLPEHQGQGNGKALIDQVRRMGDTAREQGHHPHNLRSHTVEPAFVRAPSASASSPPKPWARV